MLRKRSDRASCGATGTSGMLRTAEYDGGAAASRCVGGDDWKFLGGGDDDRDIDECLCNSFMRRVLSTRRKRSVRSRAR